ncbi:LOW QUALITY PROTEIN: uncharacterized protein [Lepeophtheirus salmonis]|uniref:LOW QUALITY PROTEIN: uncharacterized protein n=1 Tax=Lepeophtheirus salmonis TaxID=72036 RepID=UPI003AF3B62C
MMNIINVLKILLLFFHSSHTFENHKLSTQSSYLSKRSGSNLTLHCNSNYEPILCLWKTSYGHVYTLSNGVLAERGRLAHVPWKGCAMEILGVQKRDSGKWECEVGVVIGDDFVTSTENIVLAITDKETNKQVTQSTNTSTNRKSSTSGIREVGDDVIMHCSGTSGVVSLCRWKTPYHSTYIVGQGIYVERGRIQWRGKDPEKDCTIRISSLEMRDAGVWTCEIGFGGNNYNDLIIQTKDYRINIEAPLKLSTPTILTEKDQATLVCHANKEFDTCKWKTPYGSIFTFKDPQSSHENGRLSFYSFRSSKTDCGIMIERVELRDNGDWVCLVEANNNGKIHQKSSEILSLRSKSSDNLLDESINNDYSTDLDYGYSPLDIDAIDYVNGDFDKVSSISSSSISSSPPFHVPFTSLFQKKNPETSTMTVRTSSNTPQTRRSFRRKISTTISSKTLNPNKREPSKPELLLQRTPKTQQNYRLSNPRLNNPSTTINQIELKKLSTSSQPISTKAPSTSTTDNPSSFPHPFRTTSVIKSISSVYTPDKGRILVSISFKPTDKTNTDPPTVLVNGNPSQESENNQERETAKRKAIQRERERQRRLDKEKEEIRRREEERERELKRQREKQEEDMRNRKAAEDELRRIKKEEEDKLRRKIDEEERRRKAEEERLMILKVEEEEKLRMKKVEEERLRRLKEEEESLRTIKEEQDRLKRIKEEEARFKRIEQDRLKRIKEEEERLKRIKEEQERLKRTKEEEDRQTKKSEGGRGSIETNQRRRRETKTGERGRIPIETNQGRGGESKKDKRGRATPEKGSRTSSSKKKRARASTAKKKEGTSRGVTETKRTRIGTRDTKKRTREALKKQKELEEKLERQKKEQEEELKKQKEWEEEQERKKKEEEKQELNRTKELERELQKRRLEQQEEEIRRRKNQELRRRTEIELQKRRHEQERIKKEPDEDLKLSKEEHEREKIIREHERRKKFDRKRLTNLEKERQRYVDQQQQLLKKERRQFEVNRRRKLRRERYKGIKAERRIQIEPTNEPVPSTRSKESTQASIGRKRIVVIDRDEPIGTRQNVQNIDTRRRFYLNEGNTAIRRKKVNLEGERLAPKIIKSVEMSTSVKSTVREEVRQVKEIRHVSKVITISPHHSISHSHSEKSNEPIPKQPIKEVVNPFTIKENIKNLIQSQTSTSTSPPPQTPVKLPNTENDETRRECVITQPSNGNITCNGITPLDTIPPNEQCTLTCASGFVSLEKDEAKCYHGRLTQQLECVKPDALLVIGGRSDTYGVLSSVELITAQGVCRGAVPPLPQMRWKLIVIAIGRDSVLACGGAGQYGDSKGDCWLMEFNPSPKWKETQSMKLPRDSAAVAYESNKVYVLGGSLGKLNGYTDVIDVYDPQTEKWGNKGFHMTSPRHSHCAVGLGNGSIFVTGGYGGLSLAERFDIADNKWTALPELNPVRAQHGCALVDLHGEQGVIIVGGDSGGTRLGDVRFLSLKTSVWSKVAELNTARWGRPGVGVVGGRITVSAGWSGFRDLDTVEYYNEKTSAWRLTASRLQTERRWPYSTPISLSLFPKCIQKRSSG